MTPRLGIAGWAVVLAALGYTAVLVLRGRRAFTVLRAARPADPAALVTFYRGNVARKIGLLAPVALLLVVVPGLKPAQLGLAWPHGGDKLRPFAFLLMLILVTGVWWRRMALRGEEVPRPARLEILIPATPAERRWAAAASVSAGVCEEAMFRGLLILAGRAAGLPTIVAVLVAAALFGVAHLYQGWSGVLLTAGLGLAMTYFYLPTGSLLFPVLLHTVIDLRALVIVPAPVH